MKQENVLTKEEFSREILDEKMRLRRPYLEVIEKLISKYNIDIYDVSKLITKNVLELIQEEAYSLHMVKVPPKKRKKSK